MRSAYDITVHASQFPEQVRADLRQGLAERRIAPKFHYETRRQARLWLHLHEAHSPARRDPNVREIYEDAFADVARRIRSRRVHVTGLGCGGARKEAGLLRHLIASGKTVSFAAIDVSQPLVVASLAHVETAAPQTRMPARADQTGGLVCDLSHALDPFACVDRFGSDENARIHTFFGMLPNFEPGPVLDRLRGLLRGEDRLLVSANLAPGEDYAAGVGRVLPQYDNPLTRDWLMALPKDLGARDNDGELEWEIESCPRHSGLMRITACYRFARGATWHTETESFAFAAGERLRLFFSYRHTPERLGEILSKHGMAIEASWISASKEEGVFQVARAGE